MNRVEIRSLIQENNEWCVSILIPTSRTSPDRRVDTEVLKKSINHSKFLLSKKNLPIGVYDTMADSIDKLATQVDPVHASEGLGLFVSPDIARLVHFPFPIKEKVIVDKTFETRDLYFLEQFSKPYYVLKLTKNEANLFLLETGTVAREITNNHFPIRNSNEYEYARPSIGTSFGYARKGFEKDKSMLNKTRQEPFFREVQQNVLSYAKSTDLLITGSKTVLSNFESVNDNRLKIKAKIIGSFKERNDLFARARATYFECKHQEIQSLIDSLDELAGMKKVASGIREVWAAAKAGKGDVLLVEKDFRKVGYILQSGEQVSLSVPLSKHETIPDLVDHVIETINDKGGRVVFTEDHQLEKLDHIALILRY